MRTIRYSTTLAAALAACRDANAPPTPGRSGSALSDVTVTPLTADVSTGPVRVAVRVGVADARFGTFRPVIVFRTPAGSAGRREFDCSAPVLTSGTNADGVWACAVTLGPYAEAGAWSVAVHAADTAGTVSRTLDLRLGVRGSLPDGTAPVLLRYRQGRDSVDVREADARVPVEFELRDGQSGAYDVVATWGPDASAPVPAVGCAVIDRGTLAGPPLARWTCDVLIPQGTPSGAWSVRALRMRDARGNTRVMDAAALTAAGFRTAFYVAGR